jgi:hypothetical protein
MADLFQPVRQGDLITAELWNQLVSTINGLNTRVDNLERTNPQPGKLTIVGVAPKPVTMGSDLAVFGTNLGVPTENVITVGDKLVAKNKIKSGSTDRMLVFEVPAVEDVPLGSVGKSVTLTISNPFTGFDSTTITVVQATGTVPDGTLACQHDRKAIRPKNGGRQELHLRLQRECNYEHG